MLEDLVGAYGRFAIGREYLVFEWRRAVCARGRHAGCAVDSFYFKARRSLIPRYHVEFSEQRRVSTERRVSADSHFSWHLFGRSLCFFPPRKCLEIVRDADSKVSDLREYLAEIAGKVYFY